MAGRENELEQIVAELNRAVPGARESQDISKSLGALDHLLAHAVKRGASDLLLIAGAPVMLRVSGDLAPAGGQALDAKEARNLLVSVLSQTQVQDLQKNRSVDLCFSREGIGRFRANVHYQRGTVAGSIRILPEKIPTLESLNLPSGLRRLTESRQGLVLITGPTGCGKSSTLAAMVDIINAQRHDHVVTLEDPIEFVHPNRNSVIEQIEVGHDALDFANSLRSILRQDPDVIMVGEMRDSETIAAALTAAETGHLVFSTLHTNDTSQTVSRIIDSVPSNNQAQIRQQFSLALLAVIAQQLVPSLVAGRRYPAVEILLASSGVRSLIRKGEDHQIYSAIATGRAEGMITMEQSLAEMVHNGRISRETAMAHCFRVDDLVRYLRM